MDPATIGMAITAARAAVGAAKQIQSVGHALDGVFSAHEQHKKKKAKKKPKTRMQQVLRMRSGDEDYDDETSISAVANQVLEEKQNRLELESLAREIDKKWGKGTWQQILQQRKRLLAEKAAAEQLAKENALKKKKADKIFWHNFWVEAGKVVLIILFAGMMIGFVYWAANAPKLR
jgi:hypothetical protein